MHVHTVVARVAFNYVGESGGIEAYYGKSFIFNVFYFFY